MSATYREILARQAQTYMGDIFSFADRMLFSIPFLFSRRDLPAATCAALKNGEQDDD